MAIPAGTVQLSTYVDIDLWRDAAALADGRTQRAVVEQALRLWVEAQRATLTR